MKRLYLLGHPLEHSISPAMQNAALRACGLTDWEYETLDCAPAELASAVARLREPGCAGANVTIPHKQAILPLLDELTPRAAAIGAVNTIVPMNGRLCGENTDAPGLLRVLSEHHVRPRHAAAVVLGAGGAAAAGAFALAEAGVRSLVICNRSALRAADLADRLHASFPELCLAVNWWPAVTQANLVLNATAAGMVPNLLASPLPPGITTARGAIVVDLVYNPPDTELLRAARQAGGRTIGGLELLVWQGAAAFELWTGQAAPVEVMRAAAAAALRAGGEEKRR